MFHPYSSNNLTRLLNLYQINCLHHLRLSIYACIDYNVSSCTLLHLPYEACYRNLLTPPPYTAIKLHLFTSDTLQTTDLYL